MATKQPQGPGLQTDWKPVKPIDPDARVGVNLKLPAQLHRQLRLKAVSLGIGLNQAIADAVSEWLKQ